MKQQKNPNILTLSIAGKKFQVDFENYKSRSAESLTIKFSENRRKVSSSQRFVVLKYLQAEGFIR
jgi:hypothetical protein